jgi:hypothetical protein
MIQFRDMFQCRRLITPIILPCFFWSVVVMSTLAGMVGVINSIMMIPESPLIGMFMIAVTVLAVCVAALTARVLCELFLVSFRTNGNLYRIRTLLEATEQELSAGAQETHRSKAA